jgi:hypothetical protein
MELEDRMKQARRRDAVEDAIEPPPPDPFAIDPMRLVRDAVTVQSARALAMAREAGLETPCN